MSDRNTTIAYPFTKSDRAKDKIMSEVMITTLNKVLAGGDEYIKISADELLIHGYYFKTTNQLAPSDRAYIFISAQTTFPELIQYMAGDEPDPPYADHECLFINPTMDGDKFDQSFLTLIGLTYDGNQLVDADNNVVQSYGGLVGGASALHTPFYIAKVEDNSKTNKIWIKQASDDTILGPWIYDGTTWVALGAVYKTDVV